MKSERWNLKFVSKYFTVDKSYFGNSKTLFKKVILPIFRNLSLKKHFDVGKFVNIAKTLLVINSIKEGAPTDHQQVQLAEVKPRGHNNPRVSQIFTF